MPNLSSVHANRICKGTLRIDLFRLEPNSEAHVINEFQCRLKGEIAIFKALGHYDLICVYHGFREHNVLFLGSIEGIRSFSNIDCISWGSDSPDKIVEAVNAKRVIGITTAALNSAALYAYGGIKNSSVSSAISNIGYHLNSFSWGEQIAILSADEFIEVWDKSRNLINALQQKALDIHSLIGVNINHVWSLDESLNAWPERINPKFRVEWHVDLISKRSGRSMEEFNALISDVCHSSQGHFNVLLSAASYSKTQLVYELSSLNWGILIKNIRDIRERSYNLISSTRIRILERLEDNARH